MVAANKIYFLFFSPSPFLPINSLGNNAGEHNESVVPIKCIDGQLGSGRLIDFALTSGRPAGPWHAYRLMSPFTCKFKEIMRSSPRKFTQKQKTSPSIRRRLVPSRREVFEVIVYIFIGSHASRGVWVLYQWSDLNLWGFIHRGHRIEE